ncbi:uncharacterized protein [Oscarella lobularis]|uniref:uncharacterized protein isoform X2 n=1 Tax=Oscarella lobularis TaxID=121494 RepID=UPI003313ED61
MAKRMAIFLLSALVVCSSSHASVVNLDTSGNRTLYAVRGEVVALRCRHADTETARWWYNGTRGGGVGREMKGVNYTIARNDSSSIVVKTGYSYRCQLVDRSGAVVFRSGWVRIEAGQRPRIGGLPSVAVVMETKATNVSAAKFNYSVVAVPPAVLRWKCYRRENSTAEVNASFDDGRLVVDASSSFSEPMSCRLWASNAVGNASRVIRLFNKRPVIDCPHRANRIPCGGNGQLVCFVDSRSTAPANVAVIHAPSNAAVRTIEFLRVSPSRYSIRVPIRHASPCSSGKYTIHFADALGRQATQEISLNVTQCTFLGFRNVEENKAAVELTIRNYACQNGLLFQNVTIEEYDDFKHHRRNVTVPMADTLTGSLLMPLTYDLSRISVRGTGLTALGTTLHDKLAIESCHWYNDTGYYDDWYYHNDTWLYDYYYNWHGDCSPNITVIEKGMFDNGDVWIELDLSLEGCDDVMFMLEYWSKSGDDFGTVMLSSKKNKTVVSGLMEGKMYNFHLAPIKMNGSDTGKMPKIEMMNNNEINMEVSATPEKMPENDSRSIIDRERLLYPIIILSILFAISGIAVVYLCCYLYICRNRRGFADVAVDSKAVQLTATNVLAEKETKTISNGTSHRESPTPDPHESSL